MQLVIKWSDMRKGVVHVSANLDQNLESPVSICKA